jgi:multidrug resistance efflux pump
MNAMLDMRTNARREEEPGDHDAVPAPVAEPESAPESREIVPAAGPTIVDVEPPPRRRILPFVITFATVALATVFGWLMWDAYFGVPWTRDGTVRAYVVMIAPEVSGRVVELPVADNQLVRKGDVLMVIDPTNYRIAVRQGEAAVAQATAAAKNARAQSDRRQKLNNTAVSDEVKETFASNAASADAALDQAVANLEQARVNLARTRIVSPVNGYVTNLQVQLGDYVTVGQNRISVVDADSFWVDGYFEETYLGRVRVGDPAMIKLMGYSQIVRGHVDSIARGINVPNAQSNAQGLAIVNPIFTWVRLAQRIPVRIHINQVPPGIVLSAGITATVQIDHRSGE